MNDTIRKHPWPFTFVLGALFFVAWNALADLEPPGPPSEPGTMERVIYSADMPLTITTPGTYRFGGNIVAAGAGITINASHVTIDLAGFAFTGGAGHGITAGAGTSSLVVKNGTVHGWPSTGVELSSATASQVAQIRADNNNGSGIDVGPGGVVSACTAHANGANGINVARGSTVVDSAAIGNNNGIVTGDAATVTNCSAYGNMSAGIVASFGSVVTGCTAQTNLGDGFLVTGSVVSNCNAYDNGNGVGDDGFGCLGACTMTGCTASSNFEDGFDVGSRSRLQGNIAHNNGTGIRVTGNRSRIEQNNVVDNTSTGLDANPSSNNFIIGNSASGNATNYDIAATNSFGTITAGAAGFANTNSYANYTY